MIKIHVAPSRLAQNAKRGNRQLPVVIVNRDGENEHCHGVKLVDPLSGWVMAEVVYDGTDSVYLRVDHLLVEKVGPGG